MKSVPAGVFYAFLTAVWLLEIAAAGDCEQSPS